MTWILCLLPIIFVGIVAIANVILNWKKGDK